MAGPCLYFPFIKGDLGGPHFRPSLFFFLFMATGTALITFVLKLKRIRCRFASMDRHGDRALRSFFLIFLFLSLLNFSAVARAETAPSAELEGLLQKIASRHYRWIAIRADVLLFFAKEGDPNAMCGGELLYQRLDERMFLTCVDARQELMFVFRTLDRRFDLYLPAQNTVYHGSIFDLEDSPDIESHLKARDLYRALKPMAVDPRRTKVERTNSAITSLDVYGRKEDEGKLERKLYLTPEGDVRGELFYDSKERPVTEIQRYDFRELRGHVGSYDSIIFPKKVTISSPETKKGSAIFFTRVTALDTIDPLDFILRIPPGTKEIFLDEKDPRFSKFQARREEIPSKIKAAVEIPLKRERIISNTPKEKPEKKVLPPTVPEKEAAPKRKEIQAVGVQAPMETAAPENPDADLAVESDPSPSNPPSPPDAQTTLDPSVSASLEMGKQ